MENQHQEENNNHQDEPEGSLGGNRTSRPSYKSIKSKTGMSVEFSVEALMKSPSPMSLSPPTGPGRESLDSRHDTRRVTSASATSGHSHHGELSRRSTALSRKKSSRYQGDPRNSYDVVVPEEEEPEFVKKLHDLNKEKYDAHDLLVEEVKSDLSLLAETKQPRRLRKPKTKLDEGELPEPDLGVKLGDKTWVPKIINPLEIKLMKSNMTELKEVYEILEDPRRGLVHTDDIQSIIRACGSEVTPGKIEDMLKTIGVNYPGHLNFDECTRIITHRLQEQDPSEEIERAFKNMSRGRNGRVSLDDLREVSKLVDYPLTDDELIEMINAARPTGEGIHKEATLGGFVNIITSQAWYDNTVKRTTSGRSKNEKRLSK